MSATLDATAPTILSVTPPVSEKNIGAYWVMVSSAISNFILFSLFGEGEPILCEEDPNNSASACSDNTDLTVKAELIDSQTGNVTSSDAASN